LLICEEWAFLLLDSRRGEEARIGENLAQLAERLLHLTGEIEDVRRSMLTVLTNGGWREACGPFFKARSPERVAVGPPQCCEGGRSGDENPRASQDQTDENDRDCSGDGLEAEHNQRAPSAIAPARSGRSRSRRRLERDRLTVEEADLLSAPATPSSAQWVRPLSAAATALGEHHRALARYG
jgi:hypothetical protein